MPGIICLDDYLVVLFWNDVKDVQREPIDDKLVKS
jgi:hypothetical protein